MNVVIYSKEDCAYCSAAKFLLNNKGISYKEMVLGKDFTRETLLEIFPGVKTYPVIVVDGFNIGGFYQLKEKIENEVTDDKKLLLEEKHNV